MSIVLYVSILLCKTSKILLLIFLLFWHLFVPRTGPVPFVAWQHLGDYRHCCDRILRAEATLQCVSLGSLCKQRLIVQADRKHRNPYHP